MNPTTPDPIEGMMKDFDKLPSFSAHVLDGVWTFVIDKQIVHDFLKLKLLEAHELGRVAGVKEAIKEIERIQIANETFITHAGMEHIQSSLTKLL